MTNKVIILYPKIAEYSANLLSEALEADLENPYETKNRDFTKYDKVIKYGFSRPIKARKGTTVNKTSAVEISIDKLKTFEALKDHNITVEYTTDYNKVSQWIAQGYIAVGRDVTDGSNGVGLSYIQTQEELRQSKAKLWTKLVDEVQEIRIYVWQNNVLSIYVKTNDSGVFNFKLIPRSDVYKHPQLTKLVEAVYKEIGLDFCGIDIITDTDGKLNLLEVNSSPILFPYTIKQLSKHIFKEAASV